MLNRFCPGGWMPVLILAFVFGLVGNLALAQEAPANADENAGDNGAADTSDPGENADTGNTANSRASNVPMASGELDRVVMKNGEVHDGTIAGLKGGKLLLKSGGEALDAGLNVPPDNVTSIGMHAPRTMFVKEKKTAEAREIQIKTTADGKLVYVDPANPGQEMPFEYGWYLMKDEAIPTATWSFSLIANVTVNRGNTNDTNAGLLASVVRESHFDLLTFEYEFGYAELNGGPFTVVSKRFHRGLVEYKYFLADNFGLFARDGLRTDLISGLQFRNVLDLGVTFKVLDQDDVKLGFDVSGNFTYEDLVSNTGTTYGGAKVAMDYFLKLADAVTLKLYADISLNFDDTADWLSTIRATIKNTLAQGISVGLIIENNYDNKPSTGFKNNDFRIVFNVGIELKTSE